MITQVYKPIKITLQFSIISFALGIFSDIFGTNYAQVSKLWGVQ